MESMESTFLIIGGGIAGVSCIETLQFLCPNESIILITESSLIKTVTNLVPLAKSITRFDIEERIANEKFSEKSVKILTDRLIEIKSEQFLAITEKNIQIKYKMLCLCTGARPKLIQQAVNNPYILGIRDTETVLEFQDRVIKSKRIAIVGNGGIASEVVYELKNIAIDWIIKDRFISQTFVDPGAAEFFQSSLKKECNNDQTDTKVKLSTGAVKRMRYLEEKEQCSLNNTNKGAALGPDWHRNLNLIGNEDNKSQLPNTVKVHNNCYIFDTIMQTESEYPLRLILSNKETIECDFLVSATGVHPQVEFKIDKSFEISKTDNGILVNELMETSVEGIYAAGDCCTANWQWAKHWFQMRLWTQARQMGAMAGRSMAAKLMADEIYQDFCFELFGHVTQLFGYQVVLLGKFNGQGLDTNYEALIRMTPEKEYIKYILINGRLQGAILIGETGLEETTENLILNQLDLSPFGDDILNPDIDIEDYFD